MKKLVLIDGNALVHRAFHALPALTSPKGVITNAVFGFSSILLRMIKDLKPDYIAATFDLAGPTVRHSEFDGYKANRKRAPQELYDQIVLVKEVVTAFGIPIYEKPGYEADDLIGTLATRAKAEPDVQVIIATGDLDTLQLVEGTKVNVFTLKKGVNDTIIYDEAAVKERYELKPDQLVDYRGLKGDPSDNIPGVHGIGEKTAITLIQEYGTLENLYKELEDENSTHVISAKLKDKLIEGKAMAFLSKQLSIIYTDLDIDFSLTKCDWHKAMKREQVEHLFKEFGFSSLIRRLDDLDKAAQAGFDLFVQPAIAAKVSAFEIINIRSQSDISVLLDKAQKTGAYALTVALSDMTSDISDIYIATDSRSVYQISLADFKGKLPVEIRDLLTNPKLKKYTHGAKHILKLLLSHDIKAHTDFDTQIAAYLLNPDQRDYDLGKLYFAEFNQSLETGKAGEAIAILALTPKLQAGIGEFNLEKILYEIELPLIDVLIDMELQGIKIDIEILKKLLITTNKSLAELEKQIYELAGQDFNINSPAQLGTILFEKLDIKGRVKKTGGGAKSTAAPELEKLRAIHPIIPLVLNYRELQKLKTTYIEPFPLLVAADGRIHTTYSQTVAATGRLASQDPNLQNIPTRTELGQEFRKAFIAESGYQLLACDYSQLELRLAAHLANDEKMIGAFTRGEDIHTRTAAEIFGVSPEAVTKDMRRHAKTLNFGVLYGMGPVAFSQQAGVTMTEAKEFIRKYFVEFSGITRFIEETKIKAREMGYTETLFGRRRSTKDIFSTMPQVRAQAERMAVNHPIQGTEADLIKMAMIKVADYIKNNHASGEIRMLLQVHDELVFEIKSELVDNVALKLKDIMESVHSFNVPIIVDIKKGPNWAEM